jgi:hypothetical protein
MRERQKLPLGGLYKSDSVRSEADLIAGDFLAGMPVAPERSERDIDAADLSPYARDALRAMQRNRGATAVAEAAPSQPERDRLEEERDRHWEEYRRRLSERLDASDEAQAISDYGEAWSSLSDDDDQDEIEPTEDADE